MAMAFSLLGSMSGTLEVDDKNVVDKTYPRYWGLCHFISRSGLITPMLLLRIR